MTICCRGGLSSRTSSCPSSSAAARWHGRRRERALERHRGSRLGRVRGELSPRALRRHAQARRAGPGVGGRPGHASDGRAVRVARRADAPRPSARPAAAVGGQRPRPWCSSPTTCWRRSRWPTASWSSRAGPRGSRRCGPVPLARPRDPVDVLGALGGRVAAAPGALGRPPRGDRGRRSPRRHAAVSR